MRVVDCGGGFVRLDPPLSGGAGGWRLWVSPVPEPRTVKTRVHVDLRLPSADPGPLLLAVGAEVVRGPVPAEPWWVLVDPEGNEFCVFAPRRGDEAPARTAVFEVVVDSVDPVTQAEWWAGALGGRRKAEGGCAVPEPKAAKNRWHWDLDLAGESPGPLVAAGARVLRERGDGVDWWVLADPEGNEFCAFAPGT